MNPLKNKLVVSTVIAGCAALLGTTNAFAQTTAEEDAEAPVSEECLAFRADIDADIGDIMRAGCEPTLAQMAKLMDNPLGSVAMLFTQFDVYKLENPTNGKEATQGNYMGIFQFPKKLNEKWNLINRVIWNVPSVPLDQNKLDAFDNRFATLEGGAVSPPPNLPAPIDLFDGRTEGFGDLYYVGLFAKSKPEDVLNGKLVWGLGFDLSFPTASEDVLGTGKYSAGPSAILAYLGPKWKYGGLVTHYWDYSGDRDRDDVNFTNFQYLYYYSLNPTTSIGAAPNILIDWEQDSDDRVTLPIGMGINKTINIGKVPVRFGFEAFYSAVQPDNIVGSKWSYRIYIIPAVPSALFKWMQ
ncbi:MAG: hypothetical protein OEU36_12755 [Gammaproteobacteria bacterium]|nr:hypothetical protein [Gammaproteobacteria bacterium]